MNLEQFHSTPETQTDESYTHPEDIEHFQHHEHIEREEAEREAKFAGLSVEEILAAQAAAEAAAQHMGSGETPQQQTGGSQQAIPPPAGSRPPVVRVPPPEKQDPAVKYAGEKPDRDDWGTGEKGYKTPKDASERMRKNLPYKVKSPSWVVGMPD